MEIYLNEIEQQMCISYALKRVAQAESEHLADCKPRGNSKMADWMIRLEGIGAEVAACKYFNLYPDLNYEGTIAKRSYDFMTAKGSRVDVKTTQYENGKLVARPHKKIGDCDIFVLVTGSFPNYRLAGWAHDHELLVEENLTDMGNGVMYALAQSELHGFNNEH